MAKITQNSKLLVSGSNQNGLQWTYFPLNKKPYATFEINQSIGSQHNCDEIQTDRQKYLKRKYTFKGCLIKDQ